jgi:hypothetical protein
MLFLQAPPAADLLLCLLQLLVLGSQLPLAKQCLQLTLFLQAPCAAHLLLLLLQL